MSTAGIQGPQQRTTTGHTSDQPDDPSTWQRPTMIRYGLINEDTAGISYRPLDGISNLS